MRRTELFNEDCFSWMARHPDNSVHAVCTDPPYGLVEFTEKEITKLRNGRGGVWRIPPVIGGSRRDPLPRFTVLSRDEKVALKAFFQEWATVLSRILVPGAHVIIAGHPILQPYVQMAMIDSGYEIRDTVIRLYYGFRGGDRPKLAEKEFPEVCVTPKGAHEPWMLFRKPIDTTRVSQNLEKWGTGALRRLSLQSPFPDAITSGRTPSLEAEISDHPCLKPQHFMRIIVRALLPLGKGVILDPFMGSGSTIAAAQAIGYSSIGIELDQIYFEQAKNAIPRLASLYPGFDGSSLEVPKDSPQLQLRMPGSPLSP
jgi:site-specific DNA-methyltransferase (adenine-specific)